MKRINMASLAIATFAAVGARRPRPRTARCDTREAAGGRGKARAARRER